MRIKEKFAELRRNEEGGYMPHIYFGDPSIEYSIKAMKTLAEAGADFLEVGIPFSDPTADGPTFQEACERALKNGVKPETCIEGIKEIRREGYDLPIVVTTYYNIPFRFGIEDFFENLAEASVQGVIIPNMPVEESGKIIKLTQDKKIDVIFQATPNTTEERLDEILSKSSGFLYVVNFEGVTGVRKSVLDSTLKLLDQIRDRSEISLMAGFGISKKKQAKKLVSAGADGVITGSALAQIYENNLSNPQDSLAEIKKFSQRIKSGCVEGYRKRN